MRIVNVTQGSPEWHAARLGIPTSSRFEEVITPKTLKPSAQLNALLFDLLAEWITGESMETARTDFMERGKEIEPEAALWYEFEKECDTKQIGFVLSDDGRYGCSPDRFVSDANGGVEIKCPKPSTHLKYLLNDGLLEGEYRCQIQGCLWICEREWWDIVCYSPSLYMANICKRIYRDEEFIQALSGAVINACNRLDELKARAIEAGCQSRVKWKGENPDESGNKEA